MKKKKLKFLLIIPSLIGLYVLYMLALFLFILGNANNIRSQQLAWQQEHLATLQASYENGTAQKIDENAFCTFDLPTVTSTVRLNEIQVLATHNSYRLGPTDAEWLMFNSCFVNNFNYGFESLTDQFNQGIRSIEMDLLKAEDKDGNVYYECAHLHKLDNLSSCIDFLEGMREIKMWSDYNPNHIPVTVLVEIKDKEGQQGTKSVTNDDLLSIESSLRTIFGNTLATPADFLGDKYDTLEQMRLADDYPTLDKMLGKVIVMLHDGTETKAFAEKYNAAIRDRALFCAFSVGTVNNNATLRTQSCFGMCNTVLGNEENLANLTQELRYIVRSRIDSFPEYSAERTAATLASSAHFLSTDYPNGHKTGENRTIYLTESGHTVTLNQPLLQ